MTITRFDEDISFISRLHDQPNDEGGMTAAELKAEFDKAGEHIKAFINEVLLPFLESEHGAAGIGVAGIDELPAENVQEALNALYGLIHQSAEGSIVDGSVTAPKLAALSVGTAKIANGAVSNIKLADGAVYGSKLADEAVNGEKLAASAVTAKHIAAGAVNAGKIADGSIGERKLAALAVTAGKLASECVTSDKLRGNAVVSAKIMDGAVTAEKLAAGSVTAEKIGYGTELPATGTAGQIFLLRV